MPPETQNNENTNQKSNEKSSDDLARQVADRVWQLWQQELRLERERRGETRR